ncbi:MAG: DUF4280 domain-containing protein [Limnohabitans sp.]|nr:DUF4280 domain-containing protein [Limnohabitans sp.]
MSNELTPKSIQETEAQNRAQMKEVRKKEKEKDKADADLQIVIDGAKIKCDMCMVPIGTLKVNFDTPTTQDKKTATVQEKTMMSLQFNGNCLKSPNAQGPCKGLMQLGQWKDTGTVLVQDEKPLLKKSTIMCNYGGSEISFINSGQLNVPESVPSVVKRKVLPEENFEINLSLNKSQNTFVPLGILDFDNNYENRFFVFNYSLKLNNIDSVNFQIFKDNGEQIFQTNQLAPIVVKGQRTAELFNKLKLETPPSDPLKPNKIFDVQKLIDEYSNPDYTHIGDHSIFWDGFNNDEIYDSTWFDSKKLKVRITAKKGGATKIKEIEFETIRKKVEWLDVKIDKKSKKIDVNLRVDLKDGGSEGINSFNEVSPEAISYYRFQPLNYQATPYINIENYTLQGISRFWSRHSNNIGSGVNIGSNLFEVFVQAKVDKKGLAAPKIIYQTNTEEGRSRNWELSRKLFFFEGYLYRNYWEKYPNSILFQNKGWEYVMANIEDFKMTAAHEIGHEIILTYGGHKYSKSHKGSSTIITQNDLGLNLPSTGEIDLMKYYKQYYDIPRTIVAEKDLLVLIWLIKIEIK